MYYTLGSAPSDNEVSVLYGRYFSRFQPGQPIPVPYEDLNSNSIIDPDILNRIMVHILFNLDVVYDSYYEHVENLYDIVSSYTDKLDSIRSKRAELEKKVDDQLFSLRNTDGFYYSFTNAFNDTNLTDMNYTTAFVDTKSRKLTIPTIKSGLFDYVANIASSTSSALIDTIFEGSIIKSETVDISNMFNGLSNSDFSYTYSSNSIGLCTFKITIPIATANQLISMVEGRVKSQKPVEIGLVIQNSTDPNKSFGFTKPSTSDFDTFSFNVGNKLANNVEIYFTKTEPDYVEQINNATFYNYNIRIDELIISSPYYDSSAVFVSAPISLPSQSNSKLVIDAVSITVEDQVPEGADIRYYVAPNNAGSVNAYDFSWSSISPTNLRSTSSPSVIEFNGSSLISSTIANPSSGSILSNSDFMYKIPRTTTYKNPITNYFYSSDAERLGFSLYRLAKFPTNVRPYDCYMLENVDRNQLSVNIVSGASLDRVSWQQILTGQRNDLIYTSFKTTINNTQNFFTADNIPYGSIHLSTNVFCENDVNVTEMFLKSLSAQYWDIQIYLNGQNLTGNSPLSPGILSSNITWNFKKGKNEIVIIINKSTNNTSGLETSFNGSIALLKDRSILSINGLKAYSNYLTEVKVEDLRSYYSNTDNVFSIINYENNYEIVYRRTEEIQNGTKVYYYQNNDNTVSSIRIRADLFRGSSYSSAPSINSYTVKFKH